MADQRNFLFGPGSAWVQLTSFTDGSVPAEPQPVKFDVMQDISIDFDITAKELWGQLQFPVAIGIGEGKVMGKIHQARFSPGLINQLVIGQPSDLSTGTKLMWSDDDQGTSHTIPGTPYQITPTVPNSGTFVADWGVRYGATGLPLKQVANSPTTGQYSVSAGQYTFAAADTGLVVLISFEYSITGGDTITYANIAQGAVSFSKVRYQGQYGGRMVGILLPNCVGNKFNLPTKQKDFVVGEMDFECFADALNNIAYIYTTETTPL